jgi:DNA repair protein RadC
MSDVIHDLPRDERPRERMMLHGASTLSDAELLGVIIGSGMPGKNAIQLSRELLSDGIANLAKREISDLVSIGGMGRAKACRVLASIEFGRRLNCPRIDDPPPFDPTTLARRLIARTAHYTQEHLGAIFLDSRHNIRGEREVYRGTISSAFVSTRDVVRYALMHHNAAAIVVYHNHPSGNPAPSDEDIEYTRKLKQSLAICDIEFVDHLIIGAHRYTSMKQTGYI